jgi:hypothetical protein
MHNCVGDLKTNHIEICWVVNIGCNVVELSIVAPSGCWPIISPIWLSYLSNFKPNDVSHKAMLRPTGYVRQSFNSLVFLFLFVLLAQSWNNSSLISTILMNLGHCCLWTAFLVGHCWAPLSTRQIWKCLYLIHCKQQRLHKMLLSHVSDILIYGQYAVISSTKVPA